MTQRELELRRRLERRLVRKYLQALRNAGYEVAVHDGGEQFPPARTIRDAMEQIFAVDDASVYVRKDGTYAGWLRFVMGNDGYDVLSDYTVRLEDVIRPVNDYADAQGAI